MGRGSVHLDQVRVGPDALIGPEGAAFSRVPNGFDFTRPLLALTGIGCAQACVDETAGYGPPAGVRRTAGHVRRCRSRWPST